MKNQFQINDRVHHSIYGEGVIIRVLEHNSSIPNTSYSNIYPNTVKFDNAIPEDGNKLSEFFPKPRIKYEIDFTHDGYEYDEEIREHTRIIDNDSRKIIKI